jgi:signal transduction histidine kinase
MSKIEAGQLALALSDYSLKTIVETVYCAVEPLAKEKKLAFNFEAQPDLPPGHGDERRLTQVLLNLVSNAIKFTDKGEVAIRASHINGSFEVTVRDTGPGISEADQAKLFQEFQQGGQSGHTQEGRHRPWARDLKAHYRDARGKNLGCVARRRGINVFVHNSRQC